MYSHPLNLTLEPLSPPYIYMQLSLPTVEVYVKDGYRFIRQVVCRNILFLVLTIEFRRRRLHTPLLNLPLNPRRTLSTQTRIRLLYGTGMYSSHCTWPGSTTLLVIGGLLEILIR